MNAPHTFKFEISLHTEKKNTHTNYVPFINDDQISNDFCFHLHCVCASICVRVFYNICCLIIWLLLKPKMCIFIFYSIHLEMGGKSRWSQRQIHQISQRVRSKWRWQRVWQETWLKTNPKGPNQEEQEASRLRGWRWRRWKWLD